MGASPNSNSFNLSSGERVHRYKILDVLGHGGFGITYLAVDERLNRKVAIKELLPVGFAVRSGATIHPRDPSSEEGFQWALSRFIEEGRTLATFDHPSIAKVYDVVEQNGTAYLVTKLEEGRTLDIWLKDLGRRPERDEIHALLLPLLDGLRVIHSSGYLHRDIKPSNIVISDDGDPVLIDFGSARSAVQNRTRSMTSIVTPGYAPFEQYSETGDQGPWTDLFSLAGVMVRAIRGRKPPEAPKRLLQSSGADPYEPLRSDPELVKEYGESLLNSIDRAFAVEPGDRPQSALEWRDMIKRESQATVHTDEDQPSKITSLFRRIVLGSHKDRKNTEGSDRSSAIEASSSVGDPLTETTPKEQPSPGSPFVSREMDTGESRTRLVEKQEPSSDSSPEIDRNKTLIVRNRETDSDPLTEVDGAKTRLVGRRPRASDVPEETEQDARTILQSRPAKTGLVRMEYEVSSDLDQTRLIGGGGAPGEDYGSPDSSALVITKCPSSERVGERIVLSVFPFTVGRIPESDLSIPTDDGLSRRHAIFENLEDCVHIKDEGSANGVYVNGIQLLHGSSRQLAYGDEIRLSEGTSLTFTRNTPSDFPDLTNGILDQRYLLSRQASVKPNSHWYVGHREMGSSSTQVQRVAIKVLSPDTSIQLHYREAISREIGIVSELQNPHICPIVDFGESATVIDSSKEEFREGNFAYIAYALMEGGDLSDRMNRPNPMPLDIILDWHKTICSALSFAHERGVLHAGLKPASIVFDKSGNPYLTDFAFAAMQSGSSDFVMGAPAFLAPEQWKGEELSAATDQYSMAAITYLMITHRRPFVGQETPEVRERNFEMGPEPIAKCAARVDVKVPITLNPVFARALSENPEDRFPSIEEYHRELVRAASGKDADLRTSVFISYRRENGSGWATHFQSELEGKHGLRVFLDTQKQDSAMMVSDKIAREIETCDVFVCFLSSGTIDSDWVQKEIELAYRLNKPMITIRQEDFRESSNVPDDAEHIQAILSCDGVKLLDRQNEFVSESIARLAHRIKITMDN